MVVGVDVRKAPLQSKGDEISLGRQNRRPLEAILLENGHLPRRANLSGRVVKGAGGTLPAEHRLAKAGVRGTVRKAAAVVGVLSRMESADRTVEEGTCRVRARVVPAAVRNTSLGEAVLQEGGDLRRHDIGHEVRDLLLRHVGRRRDRGTNLLVPRVVIPCVGDAGGDHEAVHEVHVQHLLVGSSRVGLPEGGDLLHGGVEEGGVSRRQARLNCGHFCRFCLVRTGQKML